MQLSLRELYQQHSDKVSAKWSSYLTLYDEFFAPYRDKPIRLLELGVQNGGSLEIWAKYFENSQQFVGCDIDPLCGDLVYEDPRVQLVLGDINSDEAYARVMALSNEYDIIIDDASHRSGDIIQSFVKLFPALSEEGLYVIEDLHCSYWQAYDGGLFDPYSAISFLKQCVDVINHESWGLNLPVTAVFREGFVEKYGVTLLESTLASIASITFVNSICVIKKGSTTLGRLIVTGKDESISSGNLDLHGSRISPLDQQSSPWSKLTTYDESAVIDLSDQLNKAQEKLLHNEGMFTYLEQVIAQKQAFMDETCATLADTNLSLAQSEQALAEASTRLKILSDQNANLESSYDALLNSTSWKLTKPLRALILFVKKTLFS